MHLYFIMIDYSSCCCGMFLSVWLSVFMCLIVRCPRLCSTLFLLVPKSLYRTDVCFHEDSKVLPTERQHSKHGNETTDTGASEAGH